MACLEKSENLDENKLKRTEEKEVWAVDEHVNILVNSAGNRRHLQDAKNDVVSAFHWACRTGPLCEQRLRGVKVKLMDAELDDDPEQRESTQVMRAVTRAILGSFQTAKPVLLEPIYKIEVSVPIRWFGTCSNIITRRRGKIEATEQKDLLATISGYIPVAQTFGLSTEMRSATSGGAFWQLVFDHWGKMPDKLAADVIRQLRQRRGLPSEMPKPETFVDEVCS
jgi:elongation factor 2